MVTIRIETTSDYSAIRKINELAFGRPNEANLVDALRQNADPFISLVAELSGQVVAHIFFSPVTIENDNSVFTALGLAPLAVLPEFQNQGLGSTLVRAGLEKCHQIEHDIVVVLGHPKFYPRFGFTPSQRKAIRCEYDVPDDVFMIVELNPEALRGRKGLVKYHTEFSKV